MKLYHGTPTENRESIRRHGLKINHPETGEMLSITGGIFFSSKLPERAEQIDVWEVDASGLSITIDDTDAPPDPTDTWWVLYPPFELPPERLKLLESHSEPNPVTLSDTASRASNPNRERGCELVPVV
jgi:hypothetical protein